MKVIKTFILVAIMSCLSVLPAFAGTCILPEPTREGYIFVEWNTERDGTGDSYAAGQEIEIMNGALFAIWEKETPAQILVLKANGGWFGDIQVLTYSNKEYSQVTLPAPVLEGYTFVEYNTMLNRSGPAYHAGETISVQDMTLYAIYE